MFRNKPTPFYTTQKRDLFLTYEEGFNMHTGKRNPLQLPEDEQYTRLSVHSISSILIHTQNKLLLPALNSTDNFAIFDYETHIKTKIDYSISHIFKTMSVAEFNTIHTAWKVERTQLLTFLAMSVRNQLLAVSS